MSKPEMIRTVNIFDDFCNIINKNNVTFSELKFVLELLLKEVKANTIVDIDDDMKVTAQNASPLYTELTHTDYEQYPVLEIQSRTIPNGTPILK